MSYSTNLTEKFSLFISCPRDMEYILGDELNSLGLSITKTTPMGVYGEASLETLYKICLWSRIANRVQLILFRGKAENEKQFYQLCSDFNWQDIFTADKTIAIEFHGQSGFIRNTMYGALLVKDAIVDYFRKLGTRPDVDKNNPNILLHGFLKHGELTVSLDLVGYSLHQRGYRKEAGAAPLKENVAAGVLIRRSWPELAKNGYNLVDPFCGSGTILIEAAMMATNTAPGILREDQSLVHWKQHNKELWQKLREDAKQQCNQIRNVIVGYDSDSRVINIAKSNAAAAGMENFISFKTQSIKDFSGIEGPGVLVTNPPYGERLDDPSILIPLYQDLGKALNQHCQGWSAAVLTSNSMLAQAIGLRVNKKYSFYNGKLKAKLHCINIHSDNQLRVLDEGELSSGAKILFNRLSKNKKHLNKWLKRTGHSCYRLYNADVPEYAFAIDIYNDWAHVQEYVAPKTISPQKAERRVLDMLQVLPRVLEIPPNQVILKRRERQKGSSQYQALKKGGTTKTKLLEVHEGNVKLYVNLKDYLDTGLFLDHRPIRLKFHDELRGKTLLNCFCYTASVSVHAAAGGAITTNVDLSKTYLDWAQRNFSLNKIPRDKHQFIQADCTKWLQQCKQSFDVIFLDPPSFSNSKRMDNILDIQRDHPELISDAMKLLSKNGVLYFSTNLKNFKLSESIKEKFNVKDITKLTIDEDFKKSKHCHYCYQVKSK